MRDIPHFDVSRELSNGGKVYAISLPQPGLSLPFAGNASEQDMTLPSVFGDRYMFWVECEMLLTGSCVWALGPRLAAFVRWEWDLQEVEFRWKKHSLGLDKADRL